MSRQDLTTLEGIGETLKNLFSGVEGQFLHFHFFHLTRFVTNTHQSSRGNCLWRVNTLLSDRPAFEWAIFNIIDAEDVEAQWY